MPGSLTIEPIQFQAKALFFSELLFIDVSLSFIAAILLGSALNDLSSQGSFSDIPVHPLLTNLCWSIFHEGRLWPCKKVETVAGRDLLSRRN